MLAAELLLDLASYIMKHETLEESKEVLQRLILMPSIDLFSEHSLSKVGRISNGNLPNIDILYLKNNLQHKCEEKNQAISLFSLKEDMIIYIFIFFFTTGTPNLESFRNRLKYI